MVNKTIKKSVHAYRVVGTTSAAATGTAVVVRCVGGRHARCRGDVVIRPLCSAPSADRSPWKADAK